MPNQSKQRTESLAILGACIVFLGASPSVRAETEKHALIVCGLPGNDEYQEQFVEAISKVRTSLIERMDFDASNVRVQFGSSDPDAKIASDVVESMPADDFPITGNATRENIAAEAKRLAALGESDEVWVFVFGQSYFDGKHVYFNVPDEDLTHLQFGKLFEHVKAKSTFVISVPASGFFIKPLSRSNRVIMTSAAADAETNGSVFHIALSSAISEIAPDPEFDVDESGDVTLLDLYVRTVRLMTTIYYENDPPLIPTEHPLLDDNGDGRGSELQIDYLTMAQGGRSDSNRKRKLRKFKDGALAAKTILSLKPSDAESADPREKTAM